MPETPFADNSVSNNAGKLTAFGAIATALPILLQGALITLQLTAFSVFIGAIAGSLIGIARLSPSLLLSLMARIYIDFFRGTPLLVQIFMIYFGLPALTQEFGFTFILA